MVDEVAYDSDTQELVVTWAKTGRRSAYKGVSEDLAESVVNAPSVGSMINTEIKPFFSHRYL